VGSNPALPLENDSKSKRTSVLLHGSTLMAGQWNNSSNVACPALYECSTWKRDWWQMIEAITAIMLM
jgi:hypothetical protein